jgi:hypothetical protein
LKELILDQFEFDTWESEESLRIVIQDKLVRGISDQTLDEFLQRAWNNSEWCGFKLPDRPIATPYEQLRPSSMVEYLTRFALLEPLLSWTYYVYMDDWNDQTVLIDTPSRYILYQWMTSA